MAISWKQPRGCSTSFIERNIRKAPHSRRANSRRSTRERDQRPPPPRRCLSGRAGALCPRLEAFPELLQLGRDHSDAIWIALAFACPIVLVVLFRRPPLAQRLDRSHDAAPIILISRARSLRGPCAPAPRSAERSPIGTGCRCRCLAGSAASGRELRRKCRAGRRS